MTIEDFLLPGTYEEPRLPWNRWPWPQDGTSVPFWVYTSPAVADLEREMLFLRQWTYVCLLAQLPRPGSYMQSSVGDIPVLVTRDKTSRIACVADTCSHRGVQLSQHLCGDAVRLTCPYHLWGFSCDGHGPTIPFQHGLDGEGGMPADFDPGEHGLVAFDVETLGGAVFARGRAPAGQEAGWPTESLADWLGPRMRHWFDQTLPPGRELEVLAIHRQLIDANHLVALENLSDPYHAALLHKVIFGDYALASARQKARVEISANRRHSALVHFRDDSPAAAKARAKMADILAYLPEYHRDPDGPTTVMQRIGYSLVIGTQHNSLSMRRFIPDGPERFVYEWTFFGYADDTAEMRAHREEQSSALQGVGGLISIDDAQIFERVQKGVRRWPGRCAVLLMGGRGTGSAGTTLTEAAIRALYSVYFDDMFPARARYRPGTLQAGRPSASVARDATVQDEPPG